MKMRDSILWKLVLAFMLIAIATAGLVAVFIRMSSADRLNQLIVDQQRSSLKESLATYYAENRSWENLQDDWRQLRSQAGAPGNQLNEDHPLPFDRQPAGGYDRRSLLGFADAEGIVIVSVSPTYPGGSILDEEILRAGTPVLVDNITVGFILTSPWQPMLNPEEFVFLQRTSQALLFATGGAVLAALILGVLLARTLTRPLQALTQAVQGITRGQFGQEVEVKSKDEIGQLAIAFNRMSQEVARVNRLRRQMTADIAHDLRTPLTVIGGYVESMRDGVLQPTHQRLSLIYAEIERLQDLVGDLRMLSQADAGELSLNPQRLQPRNLLERAAELFQHRATQQNVSLSVEAEDNLPEINVDEARLMQVLGNLLINSLRYTPVGGKIILSARRPNKPEWANQVELSITDNGSGIAAEDLPYIFDRFYRGDPSRHSELGESGLGLAIVKALVGAHKGSVWAESTPGNGTAIHFTLPV